MTPDEARIWLDEMVELHGRDVMAGFLRALVSRRPVDRPLVYRGHREPLPVNGARTRTNCQRSRHG
jgi:hypothetical protein